MSFRPSPSSFFSPLRWHTTRSSCRRSLSTLPENSHIYIHSHPSPTSPIAYHLSLLPTSPPTPSLSIGTSPVIPITPSSLTVNPTFLLLLHTVLRQCAYLDPFVQSQAAAYASQAGSFLGSGGALFPNQQPRDRGKGSGKSSARIGDGAGGASSQGGAGGGGRGGWIHVSDLRAPPDYGRTAWPEDIFGSLQVDGQGTFVGESGEYQESGTYRVITREGCLGLTDYLRGKVVERLKEEEAKIKAAGG